MLAAPMLFQHTFSLHFSRHLTIRRDANQLEDALNLGCPGGYGPPQSFAIPDEVAPDMPRLIFSAVSGFSAITVGQTSISLAVNYSEDWQRERDKCVDYLKRRTHVLFDMLDRIKVKASFVGIGTRLRLMSDNNNHQEVMTALRGLFTPELDLTGANEITARFSNSVDGKYFSNAVISSFAIWPDEILADGRFPEAARAATGIEIAGDYNNRLAFNEDGNGIGSLGGSLAMIESATDVVYGLAGRFGGNHA